MTAVADILKSKSDNTVHAIAPGDSVLDALQRMAEKRIGALLVMEGETIVGIVTERDYARKIALLGRTSAATQVRGAHDRKPPAPPAGGRRRQAGGADLHR